MMNNNPIHILNQMGVITSFSVAKKVAEDDIHKFFSRYKKSGKSEEEIDKILRDKILSEIHDAIMQHRIPGLLSSDEIAKEMGLNKNIVANMPEMNRLIMVIAEKLMEKKYDKMSLCYFINSLVNMLSLVEGDFEKFHRQNASEEDGDGDGEEGYGNDGFQDA